jgi:hypothetical protein
MLIYCDKYWFLASIKYKHFNKLVVIHYTYFIQNYFNYNHILIHQQDYIPTNRNT